MNYFSVLIILILGSISSVAIAQTRTDLERSELVIKNIKVPKGRSLFVYCGSPPRFQKTISVSKPEEPEWLLSWSSGDADPFWRRQDFQSPKKGWPSKVTARCTIESPVLEHNLLSEVRFFVLIREEPLKWFDVHETSYGFQHTPVVDATIKSGLFYYDPLWAPSDVMIEIFGYGAKEPEVLLRSYWDSDRKKNTEWTRKFQTLADGKYYALITLTQTRDKTNREVFFVPIEIKRQPSRP